MTPANSDTPLRRSEAAMLRETTARTNVSMAINDDEAERREERQRSILQTSQINTNNNNNNDTSTIEDNETLKKCLELYNGNKLSRENAWSLSLIDTLSTLLDRHHKSLSNFKMAGSSLEASSKVYGLRVDSIHVDVLRMAAGLNAKKFSEKNLDLDLDDDEGGVATGGEGAADPDASAAGAAGLAAGEKATGKKKAKQKQRRAVCTITKNKETLNARLDTVALQDPIFGKLNSTVGSINSSNRLMNNVLLTTNSELRLRTNFPIFDAQPLPVCDFTQEIAPAELSQELEFVPCERLMRLLPRFEEMQLRPLHSGYVISDTPDALPDEPHPIGVLNDDDAGADVDGAGGDDFADHNQSMAFDINAECEPVPESQEFAAIVDVDYNEYDDLTTEERSAINRCRGMRKLPVLIEDLRPVDATSQLEYSYRPMDKISRFWAGPAHWKFKRSRASSLAHAGGELLGSETNAGRKARSSGQRSHATAAALLAKKRTKQLDFSDVHDDLFLKLDDNFKRRRVNIQKKWDNRKLKLPTDMRLDAHMFFCYQFAPGLKMTLVEAHVENTHNDSIPGCDFDDDVMDNGLPGTHDDMEGVAGGNMDVDPSQMPGDEMGLDNNFDHDEIDGDFAENTVLEIPTEFANAPKMVQKIVVPFAKRAKVVDMKNLKKNCAQLISKQMLHGVDASTLPQHKQCHKHEQYTDGVASFKDTLENLPQLLTQTMAESLSPAIAFYSVLHLANDLNFRLIQQDDLEDFKIRQIIT